MLKSPSTDLNSTLKAQKSSKYIAKLKSHQNLIQKIIFQNKLDESHPLTLTTLR